MPLGSGPLSDIIAHTVVATRDKHADAPHQANGIAKALRGFFQWAAGDGHLVAADPTAGVKMLKGRNDDVGFHTWTETECARFETK